jgi:hypothetical protein
MAIDNPVKVKDCNKVVKALKLGPDFGIHGIMHKNLAGVREDCRRGEIVRGHYFAVGKLEKELPDNDFYRRLWASIDVALGYSNHPDIKGNEVGFEGLPALVLGIHSHVNSRRINTYNSGDITLSSYCDENGDSLRAFPVGHDFIPELFSVSCLEIQENEAEAINRKFRRFCEERDFGNSPGYYKDYFVSRELIKRMIRKIHRELKQKRLKQKSY